MYSDFKMCLIKIKYQWITNYWLVCHGYNLKIYKLSFKIVDTLVVMYKHTPNPTTPILELILCIILIYSIHIIHIGLLPNIYMYIQCSDFVNSIVYSVYTAEVVNCIKIVVSTLIIPIVYHARKPPKLQT